MCEDKCQVSAFFAIQGFAMACHQKYFTLGFEICSFVLDNHIMKLFNKLQHYTIHSTNWLHFFSWIYWEI
jgi:hypothetical protein